MFVYIQHNISYTIYIIYIYVWIVPRRLWILPAKDANGFPCNVWLLECKHCSRDSNMIQKITFQHNASSQLIMEQHVFTWKTIKTHNWVCLNVRPSKHLTFAILLGPKLLHHLWCCKCQKNLRGLFELRCAYIGWGEEEASLMDIDDDGYVTLAEPLGHNGWGWS